MASLSAYGANVNAGVNVNADHGWGGYQWPGGVPSNLLGTTNYQQVNGAKQIVRVTVRKELVPLFELAAAIADRKYSYQIWVTRNGTGWGPWSYENRTIGGTQTASNHSRAKAWDVNAPNNPQSFTFQSDMPPGLVNDWERIGLCWGGRYDYPTKFDTMHFEYGYSPADVAGHVALAKQILAGRAVDTPAKPTPTPRPSLEGLTMIVRRDEQGVDYMWTDTYGPASYAEIIPSKGDYDLLYAAGSVDKPWGEATRLDRATIRWQMLKIQASGGVIGQGGAIPEVDPKA